MTAERRLHDDEGDFPSKIGAPGRSAGGANRADPIFQPSNVKGAQAHGTAGRGETIGPSR